MKLPVSKIALCLLACLTVTACETISESRKVDYKNSHELPPLEVPPDLTALPDANLPVASTTGATYSGFTTAGTPANSTAVLPRVPGLRIEREGQTRWLLVEENPEQLWPHVREFLLGAGFRIKRESPVIGVIETDWVENDSQDDAALSEWVTSLVVDGQRDRFRIRLDRGASPGSTEIYVAHRGMKKAAAAFGGEAAKWEPRSPEPNLEVELMRRMMVYLGKTEEQAGAIVTQAASGAPERARLAREGALVMLSLDDSLDRAWRRVGLSLDRGGFTVEDRDRSKGIYYVRYLDPDAADDQPGWLSRLFGAEVKEPEDRYQIQLQGTDAGTNVVVLNKNGESDIGKTRERILSLLYKQLR